MEEFGNAHRLAPGKLLAHAKQLAVLSKRPPDGDLCARVSTGSRAADCVRGRAQPHPHTPTRFGASPLTCARMLVFLPPYLSAVL